MPSVRIISNVNQKRKMKGNCLCGSVEFEIDGNEFNPIDVVLGETVHRDGFVFTDLLSLTSSTEPTH